MWARPSRRPASISGSSRCEIYIARLYTVGVYKCYGTAPYAAPYRCIPYSQSGGSVVTSSPRRLVALFPLCASVCPFLSFNNKVCQGNQSSGATLPCCRAANGIASPTHTNISTPTDPAIWSLCLCLSRRRATRTPSQPCHSTGAAPSHVRCCPRRILTARRPGHGNDKTPERQIQDCRGLAMITTSLAHPDVDVDGASRQA